ncbi:hypothetical protein PsorP6_013482 [Peronosclerospora sorghi]|uniref:Uncharacterized protein n=1 Tax=Peronosclerospora sorghi TaxID=230839 RepID=A0ACC0VFZ3_9STRA|nr:hypothetical protein PsorP6_013482 [Peronosclerospora sorghi]
MSSYLNGSSFVDASREDGGSSSTVLFVVFSAWKSNPAIDRASCRDGASLGEWASADGSVVIAQACRSTP